MSPPRARAGGRRRVPRALVLTASLAGIAIAAPAAHGAPPDYRLGAGVPALVNTIQWTSSTPGPNVWQLSSPALPLASAGLIWQMAWGCPVPGSRIVAVHLDGLRLSPASEAEFQILADGKRRWSLFDSGFPQAGAPPLHQDVTIPATCDARLQLLQSEPRAEGARIYWIGNPGITLRDLQAPTVQVGAVAPADWVAAGKNQATVSWSVADNFGSPGVTNQVITVAGQAKWTGQPGVGAHTAAIALDGVPDGRHELRVTAGGAGTAGAADTATLGIDRTAPAIVGEARARGREGEVRINAQDATSGIADWEVRIAEPDGPVAARRSTSPNGFVDGIDLARWAGRTIRLYVTARDAAGNTAASGTNAIAVPANADERPPPQRSPQAPILPSGRPDLSRVRLTSIGFSSPRRVIRRGKRAPLLQALPAWGRTLTISGRFGFKNRARSPLRRSRVQLRGPDDKPIAVGRTNVHGKFRFRVKAPQAAGRYRVLAIGKPVRSRVFLVTPRARLRLAAVPARVSPRGTITFRGRFLPSRRTRGRLVQLEFSDRGTWRPIIQTRVARNGAFMLRYELSGNGGFGVRLRVKMVAEGMTELWETTSRPYSVRIG